MGSILSRFDPRRSIWSYAKVQHWYGAYIRQRRSQLKNPRLRGKKYVDIGCGPHRHEGFIHLEYLWMPHIDVCWDIARGLPFRTGSMKGIFTEHVLEHFPLEAGMKLLRQCHRVLEPGGRIRIVVPDLAIYAGCYAGAMAGEWGTHFPYEDRDRESAPGFYTPAMSLNRIFYVQRDVSYGHRFLYDDATLKAALESVGFEQVTRQSFGHGADPVLVVDAENRREESLYMEGVKPLTK